MTLIKKIDTKGFKSLGNTTTSLSLGNGLIAITGPNGSGKSNIFDAITFCLGESNPSLLRVNKLNSLLYDGGNKGKRSTRTKVSITLDNIERKIPVDVDNVTISRELKDTGENTYYLNNKRIQKNILQEMLKISLIDPRSLQVIPQGKMMQVSELKPEDKRKLIEDLVGVSQFDEKKSESMKQLNDADIKLQIASARIGEIKNRVYELEGERNDQIRLEQLEKQIRGLRASVISRNLFHLKQKVSIDNKNRINLEDKLSNIKSNQKSIINNIDSKEVEKAKFIETFVDKTSNKQYEIHNEINKVNGEVNILDIKIKRSKEVVRNWEQEIPRLTKLISKNDVELKNKIKQIKLLEDIITNIKKGRKSLNKNLITINNKRNKLRRISSINNAQFKRSQSRILSYKNIEYNIKNKIDQVNNKKTNIDDKIKILEDKSRSFSDYLKKINDSIKKIRDLKGDTNNSNMQATKTLDLLVGRKQKLSKEINSAIEILSKANSEVTRYDAQKELANKLMDDINYDKIEELQNIGEIKGVIGRLDKLIQYNTKYKKAINSVGKRWLKSIIVEDVKSMMEIINKLEVMNIKDIVIIPLSEVHKTKSVKIKNKEVIDTLSNIINTNADIQGVINFIFGDSVVVNSTQSGYLISSRGIKAVTLSGDIFEPKIKAYESFSIEKMTNIARIIRNAPTFTTINNAVTSLKKMVNKRNSVLSKFDLQVKELEKEKFKRSLNIKKLDEQVIESEKIVIRYKNLISNISTQIKDLKKSNGRLNNQINILNNKLSDNKLKSNRLDDKSINETDDQLNSEISQIDKQYSEINKKVNLLNREEQDKIGELTQFNGYVKNNIKPAITNSKKQIVKNQKSLKLEDRLIINNLEIYKKLREGLKIIKTEERTLYKSQQKSKPILSNYDNKLKNYRTKVNELNNKINTIEKEVVNIQKNIENMEQNENKYLSELTFYGYNNPTEFFDNVDVLLKELNNEYEELKKGVNLLADKNYGSVFENYKNISTRRNQLDEERTSIIRFIENIDSEKRKIFLDAYNKIDRELRKLFNNITQGSAWLEIENPQDIFSSGVFLMTQFPNKNSRESLSVSGGEKTVCGLSLILAIQAVYPSPFYLFDEIDAHLDPINTGKLADILKEKARESQIIIVSLKDLVISKASLIYGVYNQNGVSKTIKYQPGMEIKIKNV